MFLIGGGREGLCLAVLHLTSFSHLSCQCMGGIAEIASELLPVNVGHLEGYCKISNQKWYLPFISFEERQWHSDCFKCSRCACSLVGKDFLTQQDQVLCCNCGSSI
ncbi:Four and a half LIM domains protein 2, partial [Ophiophagus hannah]